MRRRTLSAILREEEFDLRIMHGKILRFFGQISRVYTADILTADATLYTTTAQPPQSLRLPRKGDIMCRLITKEGNQDSTCVVLRQSDMSEQYSLIFGELEYYESIYGTSLVDGTEPREFLVK